MQKYYVSSIFYSLQGEGFNAGMPYTFLRFSGCNLNCSFCDTAHNTYSLMSLLDIYIEISKYNTNRISLCGGEPTIQLDRNIIIFLKSFGYFLHIESNGTNPLPEGIDYIVISPKILPEKLNLILGDILIDELKILVTDSSEINKYNVKAKQYILSPVFLEDHVICQDALSRCLDYIKDNPKFRLSVQSHKLLGLK